MANDHSLRTRRQLPGRTLPFSWRSPGGASLLLLLLIAFFLRVFLVARQSIWFDEAITLNLATSSFSEIVADRAANIHPPLYFFLIKGWVFLSGLDPFAVRYSSVLASFLQVPAIFLVGRNLFSRRAAWIAALLMTLSPLSVIYAQELRVYALLPLTYLALLFLAYTLSRRPTQSRQPWLLLGLVEAVALHLHYIAIFAVAYAAFWLLWSLWRKRRRRGLRRWLLVHVGVGLAGLPWLILVLHNWWSGWQASGQGIALPTRPISRVLTEPVPRSYLIPQLWSFHLTGLAGVVERSPVPLLAAISAFLVLLLSLWRLRRAAHRATLLSAAAHWFLPLLAAFSLWSLRSYSHPRYVIIFSAALLLWLAYLLAPAANDVGARLSGGKPLRFLQATLLGALLLLSLVSLSWYYFHPEIGKKDDMRGVARYLEARARPEDLILLPYRDRSLLFEYRGDTPVRMPELGNREQLWEKLHRWTTSTPTVYLVTPEKGSLDWQGVVPFALESAGTRSATRAFAGLTLDAYRLDRPVARPRPSPLGIEVQGLRLAGAWIEPAVAADTAVPVALAWERAAPVDAPGRPYGVSFTLAHADDWTVVKHDQLLVDAGGQPSPLWGRGTTMTYHLLPLPAGTPPLSYTLQATVYAMTDAGVRSLMVGETSVALGRTQLVRENVDSELYGDAAPVPPLPEPLSLAAGLDLLGVRLDREVAAPGGPLGVTLRWQAASPTLPALRPRVELVQDGTRLGEPATAPVLARYPTNRWQQGEVVTEHRRLLVPPGASGTAIVRLALDERSFPLARVEVSSLDHQFEPPAVGRPVDVEFGGLARLVGYDLPAPTVTAGRPFTVTLHWQSLVTGADRPYKVFTHLVADDGRLIGQHDAPPAQGRRPPTGWVRGEFIADPHPVAFHQPDYTGPARLAVGLYHPASGQRLLLPTGADTFFLPETLEIIPPQ